MKIRFLMFWLGLFSCAFSNAQEQQKGKASYYADNLHGRRMSNGEPYNKDSMTCAHRTLPFGTLLKVRNPLNDRTVIVRVTDRGPFSKHRIIDLSRAAAKQLDIIAAGFREVEITPYHPGVVPYRLENDTLPEIPELELNYTPTTTYPVPEWTQQDEGTADKPEKPTKETPAKEAPAKETPAKETPAKETPTKETPEN